MEIVVTGLVCLLIGFYLGTKKGRRDVLKVLRVPDGYRVSSVGYEKIRREA